MNQWVLLEAAEDFLVLRGSVGMPGGTVLGAGFLRRGWTSAIPASPLQRKRVFARAIVEQCVQGLWAAGPSVSHLVDLSLSSHSLGESRRAGTRIQAKTVPGTEHALDSIAYRLRS